MQVGKLARASVDRGLAGLEHAEGIPGTVGGALFMNAGAYGGDTASVVEAVDGIDADGQLVTVRRDEVELHAIGARISRRASSWPV